MNSELRDRVNAAFLLGTVFRAERVGSETQVWVDEYDDLLRVGRQAIVQAIQGVVDKTAFIAVVAATKAAHEQEEFNKTVETLSTYESNINDGSF